MQHANLHINSCKPHILANFLPDAPVSEILLALLSRIEGHGLLQASRFVTLRAKLELRQKALGRKCVDKNMNRFRNCVKLRYLGFKRIGRKYRNIL